MAVVKFPDWYVYLSMSDLNAQLCQFLVASLAAYEIIIRRDWDTLICYASEQSLQL